MPKPQGFWESERNNIERMLIDGWSYQEIALYYDVSLSTITTALYKLGLSIKKVLKDIGSGVSADVSQNQMEISSKKGYRIRTLEQLLNACHVDTDEWEVDHHIVNTWENFSVAHGHQTLYQVKAWLIRKKPIALKPIITPVEITVIHGKKIKPTNNDAKALVIADTHTGFEKDLRTAELTPFHDRKVLDIAVSITSIKQPKYIICMGDWFDLADWSDRFIREPQFWWTTQPAIEENAWWLGKLRTASPDSKIILFEGNHEKRVRDKITKATPESYDIRQANNVEGFPVMSIPYLLNLEAIDVEWIGDYPVGTFMIDGVVFSHGVKHDNKSGGTVRKVLDDAFVSQVVGHAHSMEIAWRRIPDKEKYIFAASCPCACHIDGRVPGSKPNSNWSKGLMLMYGNEDDLMPSPITVIDGIGFEGHEIYKSRDEKEIVLELKQATDNRWKY